LFVGKDCDRHRELYKWLRWCLTDVNAKGRATKKGFEPLSDKLALQILGKLADNQCGGQSLLASTLSFLSLKTFLGHVVTLLINPTGEVIERHEKGYFEILLIISMVLLVLVCLPVIYFLFRTSLNSLTLLYYIFTLIGESPNRFFFFFTSYGADLVRFERRVDLLLDCSILLFGA